MASRKSRSARKASRMLSPKTWFDAFLALYQAPPQESGDAPESAWQSYLSDTANGNPGDMAWNATLGVNLSILSHTMDCHQVWELRRNQFGDGDPAPIHKVLSRVDRGRLDFVWYDLQGRDEPRVVIEAESRPEGILSKKKVVLEKLLDPRLDKLSCLRVLLTKEDKEDGSADWALAELERLSRRLEGPWRRHLLFAIHNAEGNWEG